MEVSAGDTVNDNANGPISQTQKNKQNPQFKIQQRKSSNTRSPTLEKKNGSITEKVEKQQNKPKNQSPFPIRSSIPKKMTEEEDS